MDALFFLRRGHSNLVADLTIRPAKDCALDGLSIGETMLRLDPSPVPTARAKYVRVFQGLNPLLYDS